MTKDDAKTAAIGLLNTFLPAAACAAMGAFISVRVMARDVEHLQQRTDRIEGVAAESNRELKQIAVDVAYIRGQMENRR